MAKTAVTSSQRVFILGAVLILTSFLYFRPFRTTENSRTLNNGNEPVHKEILPHHRMAEEEQHDSDYLPAKDVMSPMHAAIQRRRQAILHEACAQRNLSSASVNAHPAYHDHMIVNDDHNIIFNFIPKVSSKTWRSIWTRLRTFNSTGHSMLIKYELDEQYRRLETYRKVLFVREPLNRLLSAYQNKFRAAGTMYNRPKDQRAWEELYGPAIVKRYRNMTMPKNNDWLNITLSEAIRYISHLSSNVKIDPMNSHFLPQQVLSQPCSIKYDFIGHFENIGVEGPYIIEWLGIQNLVKYPKYHASRAENSLSANYGKLPLEIIRMAGKYYEKDYEFFGYSFEKTLALI